MNAIVFDTLQLARKLEAAGFTPQQSQGAAAALSETLGDRLASQRDIQDLDAKIESVRQELKRDIADLRQDFKREIDALRAEMREQDQRQTIRTGSMLAAAVVLIGALIKLL